MKFIRYTYRKIQYHKDFNSSQYWSINLMHSSKKNKTTSIEFLGIWKVASEIYIKEQNAKNRQWDSRICPTHISVYYKALLTVTVRCWCGLWTTCTPMADSCQCMAKPIQYGKVISLQLNKFKKEKRKVNKIGTYIYQYMIYYRITVL